MAIALKLKPPGKKTDILARETVLILCIEELLLMIGLSFLGPIMPKFVLHLGIRLEDVGVAVGLAIAVYGLARALIDIPAGKLAGRFGRRMILVAAPVVVAVSALGCGLSTAYWQLLTWRLVQGAGSAAFSVAAIIVLGEISSPSNRGLYMSFFWSTFLIGASLGPSFGGLLGEYTGYRAPFFVYAALAFLSSVWGYLRLPETKTPSFRSANFTEPANENAPGKLSSSATWKNKNFILVSLVAFLTMGTIGGTQNTLIPILGYERLFLSESKVGLTLSLVAVIQLLLTPFAGRLSDQVGRKMLIVPGGIITALGFLMFIITNNYAFFLVSGLALGIGRGLGGPVPTAYVADIAPRVNYESTLAQFRTASDLGMVAGPVVCGWLKDFYGIGPPFYLSAGLFALVTILFGFCAKETIKRE